MQRANDIDDDEKNKNTERGRGGNPVRKPALMLQIVHQFAI